MRLLAAISVFLAAFLTGVHGASAHDPTSWAVHWDQYSGGDTLTIMACDDSINGSSCESNMAMRILDGATTWNGLAPLSSSAYGWTVGAYTAFELNASWGSCNWDDGYVVEFLGNISGTSTLGLTGACVNGQGRFVSTASTYNSNIAWYLGTGNVPAGEHDLWGVAAHETGHATGIWAGNHHFTDSNTCPSDTPSLQATMCPSLGPAQERWRTLEPHDKHTFTHAGWYG